MSALRYYLAIGCVYICAGNIIFVAYGYKAFPDKYYYESLGLYKVPTTAPWTQSAKAPG